ncbi:MAG: two-component system chemotaxis response regulator CheB [Kiritimatiellia bacterium]|jgi:two-component system chemotaxis response regulator CheB
MSIGVLIVDDSAVIRRMLGQLLGAEDGIEVVGKARNGQHGISQVHALNPDVVIMDLEMPVMDGVDAVRKLRVDYPRLPIIMFSSHTDRGARSTMEALVAGATAYVCKNPGSKGLPYLIKEVLAVEIRRVAGVKAVGRSRRTLTEPVVDLTAFKDAAAARTEPAVMARPARPARSVASVKQSGPLRCLAVGCSTGGPAALMQFLPGLAADIGVPILIVQHMPPKFTKLLADRLDTQCAIRVVEGSAGEEVLPGTAYIAPGGYHMCIHQRGAKIYLTLDREEPVNSCRPAVDRLFDSIAKVYGGAVLGVIMTGMGQDGMNGCRSLVDMGASILTQDEESCVVWGMPRAVVMAGLASQELPLNQLSSGVMRHFRKNRFVRTA